MCKEEEGDDILSVLGFSISINQLKILGLN